MQRSTSTSSIGSKTALAHKNAPLLPRDTRPAEQHDGAPRQPRAALCYFITPLPLRLRRRRPIGRPKRRAQPRDLLVAQRAPGRGQALLRGIGEGGARGLLAALGALPVCMGGGVFDNLS